MAALFRVSQLVLLRKQEPRAHGQFAAALGSCFRRSTIWFYGERIDSSITPRWKQSQPLQKPEADFSPNSSLYPDMANLYPDMAKALTSSRSPAVLVAASSRRRSSVARRVLLSSFPPNRSVR